MAICHANYVNPDVTKEQGEAWFNIQPEWAGKIAPMQEQKEPTDAPAEAVNA